MWWYVSPRRAGRVHRTARSARAPIRLLTASSPRKRQYPAPPPLGYPRRATARTVRTATLGPQAAPGYSPNPGKQRIDFLGRQALVGAGRFHRARLRRHAGFLIGVGAGHGQEGGAEQGATGRPQHDVEAVAVAQPRERCGVGTEHAHALARSAAGQCGESLGLGPGVPLVDGVDPYHCPAGHARASLHPDRGRAQPGGLRP